MEMRTGACGISAGSDITDNVSGSNLPTLAKGIHVGTEIFNAIVTEEVELIAADRSDLVDHSSRNRCVNG